MSSATTEKRNPWFTISILCYGLLVLFVLLVVVSTLGAIGPVEIYV